MSTFTDMPDTDFIAYLKMLDDTWKDLPTDKATAYAWKIFLSCVERFGKVTITCDMEAYGREPGDIVTVQITNFPGVVGPFPLAMTQAALSALAGAGTGR